MNVILLIGFRDGLLLVQNALRSVKFLLEKSGQRRMQMTNVSGSPRGKPWQDERMLSTTHIRDTAADETNWTA